MTLSTQEIKIIAEGPVGSGKSALLGEIEILCKALGVPVRYANPSDSASEKSMTHADWTAYLEMYKPSVVLHEQGPARDTPPASAQPESQREGYPHDAPKFVALCREHDILGTAMQGLAAVFWRGASAQDDAKDERTRVMEIIAGVWDRATQIDDAADEVIDLLRAPAAGDALAWQGLTEAERDGYVGELVDYGTDFVAPLYSVVESIEKRLREKNAAQQGDA